MLKISFSRLARPKTGAIVVTAYKGGARTPSLAVLDRDLRGMVGRALKSARFTGRAGEIVELLQPFARGPSRVLVVGLGERAKLKAATFETAGGLVAARLLSSGESHASIMLDQVEAAGLAAGEPAARLAFGAALRAYRFDAYRTKLKAEEKASLKSLSVQCETVSESRRLWAGLEPVADSVHFVRDLVTEPANILYPEEFARRVKELEALGLGVEILGPKEMKKLGMGALLGVAQGSVREARLVVLTWNGGPPDAKPLAFVGKGVCFDTGGISLKPPGGMEDMKWDMGGAAVVAGLMRTLALRKAKANAVGILGLVENMPDGNAQRPGDVVTSASGQTIEVINTDAEGRLVLADAVWYVQDRFKPQLIVDLATLTGAIIISLAHEYAGLFSNDDELARRLSEAGIAESEGVWRMPMGDAYDKHLASAIADMKNVGPREGGSITAAQFIQRFVKDVPWAHLDIAGTVWINEARALHDKGATGYGVRLLNRLVADHYET
ncbi:MAG: leucyl aminopeptidase [Alphaproteobacteria bacterium]|nr:leucyl aminopeptidase [Alphaproteobacteria bacterium]